MLLRFKHFAACINSLLFFIAESNSTIWINTICISIYQLIDILVVSSLCVNKAVINIHVFICGWEYFLISLRYV